MNSFIFVVFLIWWVVSFNMKAVLRWASFCYKDQIQTLINPVSPCACKEYYNYTTNRISRCKIFQIRGTLLYWHTPLTALYIVSITKEEQRTNTTANKNSSICYGFKGHQCNVHRLDWNRYPTTTSLAKKKHFATPTVIAVKITWKSTLVNLVL